MIMETMYGNKEDGLCGNDDAGQMSSWYLFSALGFYPVAPGSDEYAIGSPLVNKATVQLGNGKAVTINTVNQSKENVYIEKVEINGREVVGNILKHSDIANGGEVTFYLRDTPKQ